MNLKRNNVVRILAIAVIIFSVTFLLINTIFKSRANETGSPSFFATTIPTVVQSPTQDLSSAIINPTATTTEKAPQESPELTAAKKEFMPLYGSEKLNDGKMHMILDLSNPNYESITVKMGDGTDFVTTAQYDGYVYVDGKWQKGTILDPVCRSTGRGDYFCLSLSNTSIQIAPFPMTENWDRATTNSTIEYYGKSVIIVEIDINSDNPDIQTIYKGLPGFNAQTFTFASAGNIKNVIPAMGIAYPAK